MYLYVTRPDYVAPRHLPGKHDQKTHGGGAGGGYKPGNWRKVTHEERVNQQLAALEEEVSPAVKAKHGPEGLRRHAERMVGTEGTTYVNGEHKVFITSKNLTDAEHTDVLANVDELETRTPLGRPLNMVVAPKREFGEFVGGDTNIYAKDATIRLNESVYLDYDRQGKRWAEEAPSWSMASAQKVKASRYVLTHEWGHAQEKLGRELRPRDTTGMSRYGLTTHHEGFAEAFAEFTLSGGKTGNPTVKAYASLDDWGEKWPSLATTSATA